jgi:hypothetical protein
VAGRPGERRLVPHVIAGVLFPIVLVAACSGAATVLPPGS